MNRIRFKCLGKECNRCCTGGEHGSYVTLVAGDLKRLGADVDKIRMRFKDGHPLMVIPAGELCVFWKEGVGCSIWDRRPNQCSSYPGWPRILNSKAAIEAEKERCPGIGQGPRLVLSQIRSRMRREGRIV